MINSLLIKRNKGAQSKTFRGKFCPCIDRNAARSGIINKPAPSATRWTRGNLGAEGARSNLVINYQQVSTVGRAIHHAVQRTVFIGCCTLNESKTRWKRSVLASPHRKVLKWCNVYSFQRHSSLRWLCARV